MRGSSSAGMPGPSPLTSTTTPPSSDRVQPATCPSAALIFGQRLSGRVQQDLDEAADRRQRRAQLMRDRSDEPRLQLVELAELDDRRLDPGRHRVEGLGGDGRLANPATRDDPLPEIAVP